VTGPQAPPAGAGTETFGEAPPSTLSWVLNGYTITFAALLVPAGKLADRLGHRRAFLTGSAVFTVASMACGLAPSVALLIVARIFQGTGAAILVPASLALVMAAFPRHRLPQVVAIWGAIGAFSAALGPSLGALVSVWGLSILEAGFGVAPGPLVAALLAPRFGSLAGQIGQRPLVIIGGLLFAASGLYRVVFLTAEVDYLVDFAVPLALVAVAVPLVFPQVTSVAAQALPTNQIGVGGGTTQAVRQFGGSFGVAVAIALVGTAVGLEDLVAGFDRVWWFAVAGGLLTTLFAVPLRTGRAR